MYLTNISPEIDSCKGLILQEARKYYNRIPSAHQRWQDPEDLIQEALLTAVREVGHTYDATRGKYSSYLYIGLRNRLSRVCLSLVQQKRQASIVEIDAPLPDDRVFQLPAAGPDQATVLNAAQSFTDLCIGLGSTAVIFLARSFLLNSATASGRHSPGEASVLSEIRRAAAKKGTDFNALRELSRSQEAQKMALTQLAASDIIDLGHDMDARILECTECEGTFPLTAIRGGRFIAATMTCVPCYASLGASPMSCFGKQYNPEDLECKLHCRDRSVCRLVSLPSGAVQFISEVKNMATAADTATAVELDDVDLSDIEETPAPAKPKTSKKAAPKAAVTKKTPAKATKQPAKAAKPQAPPKEKEEEPPSDIGPRWPFKKNSIRGYAFQRAYAGCKKADLQKEIEDLHWDFELVLRNLRRAPHTSASKNTSHTWSLNEEGGRLKIYDVKYLGGKKK